MTETITIPIRYTRPWTWLLVICGCPPRWSDIRIDDGEVLVRMALAFHARFDRRDVAAVVERDRVGFLIGTHGWKGRWLVNGARDPIAVIVLREPVRARVLGFPVRLRELLVSVDDVAALERALTGP